MKIIIVSLSYLPKLGGLENIMAGLANEWSKEHEVTVFTKVDDFLLENDLPYKIFRSFNIFDLWCAVKKADVFIEANISFKTCLVGLLNFKKWYLIHHLCYPNTSNGKIKIFLTRFAKNISCSHFVSTNLPRQSIVIPNFFDDRTFKLHSTIRTKKSLVFLGRLVSDKGIDLLIEALNILNSTGKKYQLTIIGNGPEENKLNQIVNKLNLENLVSFKGVLKGEELAIELNKHEIMVIPSRWKEPFGIVALEGLACGCKIVCPDEGGLNEAAGSSAFLYRHNFLDSLVYTIEKASKYEMCFKKDNSVKSHLLLHSKQVIANQYLDYFKIYMDER